MKASTVRELKELIANLPDDMKLVKSGSDHSFDSASADVVQAEVLYSKSGKRVDFMWEYFDEGNRSSTETKVENVLLVY